MAKTVNKVVGVDIGTRTMKVAELQSTKDRPILTGVGIAPTPPGAVDHAGVHDPVGLGAALKRLLAESGISTKMVVLGISGQSSVVVRILEVPRMSQGELKEHMQWEIQRNIPFADTNIVTDFRPVNRPGTPPDSQNMDVVLAVAPQDAVDRMVDLSKAAGVKAIGIDVEPLALGRSLILSHPELYGDKNICVVNIGASSTTIDVYQSGLLAFPRILPIGGDSFTQSIINNLGVTEEEAERLKRENAEVMMQQMPQQYDAGIQPEFQAYQPFAGTGDEPMFEIESDATSQYNPTQFNQTLGTPGASGTTDYRAMYEEEPAAPPVMPGFEDYTPVEPVPQAPQPQQPVVQLSEADRLKLSVFQAIYNDLEELVGELRRSIEYYRSRAGDAEIDQILLCGGTANIRNLDEYLHTSLGIPVAVADPLRSIQVASKRYSQEFLVQNALLLPVAIGMAMHAFYE